MQVVGGAVGGDGDCGGGLLEDLDSYLEEINSRLTVSRMVSGAVLRGLAAAIQEEAAGEILASRVAAAAAAVELARLKKSLPECGVLMAVVDANDGTAENLVQQQNATSDGGVSPRQVPTSDWRRRRQAEDTAEPQNAASNGSVFSGQVSLSDWRLRWRVVLDVDEGRVEESARQQEAVSNGTITGFQVALFDWTRRREVEETECWSCIRRVSEFHEELALIERSLSFPNHGSAMISRGGTAEGWHGQGWDPVLKTDGLNPDQLKRMTKEGLLKYINEEMSEMRRSYESHFHRLTDDYFRDRDRDRDPLDLSGQISQLLSKLDAFLSEHADSPARADLLESLRSDNRRLRTEMDEREEEMGGENRLFGAVVADFYGLVIRGVASEVEESVSRDLMEEEVERVAARGAAEGLAGELRAEREARASLEKRVSEGERELRWMKEEMEEQEARFGGAVGELRRLSEQVREQEGAVARGVREVGRVRAEQEATVLKIVEACEQQVRGVKEKMEASSRDLEESRKKLEAVRAEDAENRLRLVAAVEGAVRLLGAISSFETRVVRTVGKSASRLEISEQELRIQADKLMKKSLLLNKSLRVKRHEHMSAECRVGLLSEEVVSLSSLLDKIYRALDHYSPILHHYPGVMDILELIRREIERGYLKDKPLPCSYLFTAGSRRT